MIRLGEIIESNTNEFVTQCYNLYSAPSLGTLVKAGQNDPIFGIVSYVQTLGLDPTRRPLPRGKHLDDESEIYEQNPQLNQLLTTEFKSIIIGHSVNQNIEFFLSPTPPKIHSFVQESSSEEISKISTNIEFLETIIYSNQPQSDDIVASFIRQVATIVDNPNFVNEAAKKISAMLRNDTQRLNSIFRRLRL